jgi:hypothetical protein
MSSGGSDVTPARLIEARLTATEGHADTDPNPLPRERRRRGPLRLLETLQNSPKPASRLRRHLCDVEGRRNHPKRRPEPRKVEPR